MPTRPCAERTCPEPATYRGRCAVHQRQRNRDTHRNRHIYNSKRWKILRAWFLFDNPLCKCGAIATDVHHIQDIEQGGDPWAPSNLEALCHPCHSAETRKRQGATT